jgi:hypothetical protein
MIAMGGSTESPVVFCGCYCKFDNYAVRLIATTDSGVAVPLH